MKKLFAIFGVIGACACMANASAATNTASRGNQALANAYRTNQRNTYYMVTQLDVETACSNKIYACLAAYCGDVTVVPGLQSGRCASNQYVTESELYNYALLCLSRDTEILIPQYANNMRYTASNTNTAARLCPSYVQQEVMAYLSMANLADQLGKSHSDLCLQRRQELEAAMACHSVALAYGNETSSMLTTQLTDYCGAGVAGGSAEMVTRFANAGNLGASVWGWAEKIVNLELNKKGEDWQSAVDAVLASYTNRMNLACGTNLQLNTVSHTNNSTGPTTIQKIATLAVGGATTTTQTQPTTQDNWSVFMEVTSLSELYNYNTANQVVQAAMTQAPTTPNGFLNSAQISDMQTAYARGTKLFIIRDSTRCFMVPVVPLTQQETLLVSQSFANCISQ